VIEVIKGDGSSSFGITNQQSKEQDDDNGDEAKRLVRPPQVKTSRAESKMMIMETKGRGL
jgi:hypothetical protein